jgi:DNA repair protein RadC
MSDAPPLLPENVRTALPRLYATEHAADPIVHAKLFTPWAGWTWFITEFDGEDTLFGLVSGHEVELGYISLAELEALEGPGGLRVERDRHFTPRPLSLVRRELDEMRETPGTSQEESPPTYSSPETVVDPVDRPAIRLVETQLTDAWAHACSGTLARPQDAARLLQRMIGTSDREQFAALYLNNRHQMTHAHIVSTGTVSTALVHPREVFKAGVLANATAVIVGHNHPSGDVTPSAEDRRVAERLKSAGEVLGIPLLDALIVGPTLRFYCESAGTALTLPPDSPSRPPPPSTPSGWTIKLETACRNLLQDIDEVLERAGEEWWDETVTSGTFHRGEAEKLLGLEPYRRLPDAADLDDAPDPG